MKIGLLLPSMYMSPSRFGDLIFAPRELSISLANGLVAKGHEVYFFTAPEVETNAHLVSGDKDLLTKGYVDEKLLGKPVEQFKWGTFFNTKKQYEIALTSTCFKMAKEKKLDIIHSYHDTMAHFFEDLTGFPTVYTLHDPLPHNGKSLSYWLLNKFKKHTYVSISNSFRRNDPVGLSFVDTVYHGIECKDIPFSYEQGEYLASIGRFVPEKGMNFAIEVAKKVHQPLIIATSDLEHAKLGSYYQNEIEPLLNQTISFKDYLKGNGRFTFLKKAKALLFPIAWEEPFGMVMIEALSCGTPVIAYNRGSVAEIVQDGVTGFIIDPDEAERPGKGSWIIKKTGIAGLTEAIHRLSEIDRKACRQHVEQNFSVEQMVQGYERVYAGVLNKEL